MAAGQATYPVRFGVDYPETPLDRLSTALRLLWALPILVVLAAVSGDGSSGSDEGARITLGGAGGLLFLAPLIMIVFRRRYPRWWFDWNLALARFGARVVAYLCLLTDRYPATDDEQAVHLDFPYPDVERDLNRWLPLVKWLLALPHYVVLLVLGIAAFFAVVAAWFAIIFTGGYPRTLFDFVVGVLRWGYRVLAYAFLLTTDRYPPFRLSE